VNDPTPNQSEQQRTKTESNPTIRTKANPHGRERPRDSRAMASDWGGFGRCQRSATGLEAGCPPFGRRTRIVIRLSPGLSR
jgi:hypothetical protein